MTVHLINRVRFQYNQNLQAIDISFNVLKKLVNKKFMVVVVIS